MTQLRQISRKVRAGETLDMIFAGISGVNFSVESIGPQISLRITKKEGVPVAIVPEGSPGSGVVAVRRVDELGFYNLGHRDLARKLKLTPNKATAAISVLDLKSNPDCFKAFRIGGMLHQRYSQNAITRIRELLESRTVDDVWQQYREMKASSLHRNRKPTRHPGVTQDMRRLPIATFTLALRS